MWKKIKRSKKKFYVKVKKHTETLVILGLMIGVLSLLMPFMVGDKYVLYRRIHVINLTPATEVYGSFSSALKFSVTGTITFQRTLPNGTIITLTESGE